MKSELTEDFIRHFKKLPSRIRNTAKKKYKLWRESPAYPSLEFKRLQASAEIYFLRFWLGWRALEVMKNDDTLIWFWK